MLAVCGSGSWGSALASVLADNLKQKILMWGPDASQIQDIQKTGRNDLYFPNVELSNFICATNDLTEIFKNNKDIVLAVPSAVFTQFLQKIKPMLNGHRLVFATKGLEKSTGEFLHKVIAKELGEDQVCAVLSGPSFAKEVIEKKQTAVAIAANNTEFAEDLKKYFSGEYFSVEISDDLLGVQLGGVGKNVLAVAVGIADGVCKSANTRAAIMVYGLNEILKIGKALGVNPETLFGLAGIGDTILTCTDDLSRNRRFGLLIAKGYTVEKAQEEIGQVVEAVDNIAEIYSLGKKHNIDIPVIENIQKMLQNELSPQDWLKKPW